MFECNKFVLPVKVNYRKDITKKGQFWTQIKELMLDNDVVCEEIHVDGNRYMKGELIVQEVLDGGARLRIGLIKMVLVQGDEVFFVTAPSVAMKTRLGFYEGSIIETSLQLVSAFSLADAKSLIMRGTSAYFNFVLHHHISFRHP